ncbi:zwilch [Drosophila busckii]|uniref:Protein zwilch n=1 Tax=Drosophila busckii TaxID=30019 RepID=A0A0M4F791_DROBS|nr:zwilch [Drosophila busckii]
MTVNTYAELLRKYGEIYTITYNTPPTYLSRLVGARETGNKIILFYKEDRTGAVTTTPTKLRPRVDARANSLDLDLTGSPLKDDCLVEAIGDISLDLQLVDRNPWKRDEEYHRGENPDILRAIICSEQFQQMEALGSVWFLCDGSDFSQTQLLQYEFNPTHFSRGVLSYAGVLPAYMLKSQSLVQQHAMTAGMELKTYIENCYQVNPHMMLRCSWSTPSPLPALTELRSCTVLLNSTFRVGDCSSLTEDFMNQLRILVYIREDIISFHNDEQSGVNRDPIYRCGSGIDINELRESITKTMTEVSGFNEGYVDAHANCDIEENTPTNKNRLAEIITNLANSRLAMPCLSGAEPLELLLEIGLEKIYKDYEFIFTESKLCSLKELHVSVNVSNGDSNDDPPASDLSKLRKSLHNAARGDAITSSGMRKTLLHPGHKQTSAKYPNGDDVFKNSSFDEQESVQRISKLFQIHCMLEHLLMMHINLNIPNVYADVCAQLLNRQPHQLEGLDDKLSDTVDIRLSAHYVVDYLNDKEPHSRQITMKSQNKLRDIKTTFYYNVENVCPPALAQCFQSDDKELVKERTYHAWIYRKIRTLK